MAAKRIAKSAVDWVAFAERVPPAQIEAFRQFRSKCAAYQEKVNAHPENPQAIDWAGYKSKLGNAPFIAKLEEAYKNLKIPYPTDKANVKATVDAQEAEATAQYKQNVALANEHIAVNKSLLGKVNKLPPASEMTHEMWADYFPELARNPAKPTMWPHTHREQPGNDPHEIK